MLSARIEHYAVSTPNELKLPLRIKRGQFLIKKHPEYDRVIDTLRSIFKMTLNVEELLCYYCGSTSNNIIPDFLHDGSARNLWQLKDPRTCCVLCEECNMSYGLNKVRYFGHYQDLNPQTRPKYNKILSFEPEVLIPTIEPTHLHFEYSSNGRLIPLSQRASRTIEAFNLNRTSLVERRISSMNRYKYNKEFSVYDLNSPFDILFIYSESHKNSSAKLINNIERSINKYNMDSSYYIDISQSYIPYKEFTFQNLTNDSKRNYAENFPGIDSFSFSGVRNFKTKKTINFKGKNSIIILGENGVGKSTFLELLTKALKTREKRSLAMFCNTDISCPLPSYEIKYSGEDIELKYKEEKANKINRKKCNLIHVTESRMYGSSITQLINWINTQRENQETVDWIASKLSLLLNLQNSYLFNTKDGDVYWEDTSKNNNQIKIDELSSGYNSIITIFSKIVTGVSKINELISLKELNLRLSSSIILIDEVELHLHPKFKKNIILNLQSAFPEVLFLITTHDPLVLKSMNKGTIIVNFKKINEETFIIDNLPSPYGLTTEQILTSPHFGLNTISSDEDLSNLIEKYHISVKEEDWNNVDYYKNLLSERGYFGKTYREKIAFAAVDAYLSVGNIPSVENILDVLKKA